jgi:chromosome partitioning protein
MLKIIAIVNQKGGVGKTTTAVNVSAMLADKGQSVLLVDLDPQGNTTSGLGLDKQQALTTYDVMCKNLPIGSAIQHTHIANLDILPANADLAAAEIELVNLKDREYVLNRSLIEVGYDLVIIDCPPALGLLTINALSAAYGVIIPVQTEYYALEGLGQLLTTIQAVKQSTNPSLNLLGIVMTMYDKRNALSEQVYNEVANYFKDKLFKTVIPRNVRLAEAPSYGKTVYEHDSWSKGARAYKSLTKEILQRIIS